MTSWLSARWHSLLLIRKLARVAVEGFPTLEHYV